MLVCIKLPSKMSPFLDSKLAMSKLVVILIATLFISKIAIKKIFFFFLYIKFYFLHFIFSMISFVYELVFENTCKCTSFYEIKFLKIIQFIVAFVFASFFFHFQENNYIIFRNPTKYKNLISKNVFLTLTPY